MCASLIEISFIKRVLHFLNRLLFAFIFRAESRSVSRIQNRLSRSAFNIERRNMCSRVDVSRLVGFQETRKMPVNKRSQGRDERMRVRSEVFLLFHLLGFQQLYAYEIEEGPQECMLSKANFSVC